MPENLKKTSVMKKVKPAGNGEGATAPADASSLSIGNRPTAFSPYGFKVVSTSKAAEPPAPQLNRQVSVSKPNEASPQPRFNYAQINEQAAKGNYKVQEPLAMGAESMLFSGKCANEMVVIKSVRSKLNRWVGNDKTRNQKIKLTKVKYAVKKKHILNEYNIGKMLYANDEIPVVHIYAIKRHSFFWFDLGYDLVMEYLPGSDLGNQAMVQSLSLEERIRICIQAFQALNYVHKHKLVHLDIKPSNFMYNQGVVKLFDFGISALTGSHLRSIVGTAGYLSPEQIARDVVTEATDLFAMGITMGTLFGGCPMNQQLKELHSSTAKASAKISMERDNVSIITDLPDLEAMPGLVDILRKCCILKRSARTQTSTAVLYQLKAWAKSAECPFDIKVNI